jgi:SPP1 gp7 family putative phage head morphogenesis protein
VNIYDEDALVKLEQEEHEITEEALILMFATLTSTKVELENELRAFYQKYGKDGVVTYAEARKWVSTKEKRKRINVLLLFVAERFSTAYDLLKVDFVDMVTDVIYKELKFFDVDFDPNDLKLKWGYDKLDWCERLANDVTKWSSQIRADVKQGILQRKNLNDILQDIEDRFESIEKVLETLGISETTAVGTIARHEIFKELGITKYKIYTRNDERRCELCGTMHEKVFPMVEYEVGVTASPFHSRCRCWEVPIKE